MHHNLKRSHIGDRVDYISPSRQGNLCGDNISSCGRVLGNPPPCLLRDGCVPDRDLYAWGWRDGTPRHQPPGVEYLID